MQKIWITHEKKHNTFDVFIHELFLLFGFVSPNRVVKTKISSNFKLISSSSNLDKRFEN